MLGGWVVARPHDARAQAREEETPRTRLLDAAALAQLEARIVETPDARLGEGLGGERREQQAVLVRMRGVQSQVEQRAPRHGNQGTVRRIRLRARSPCLVFSK